MWRREQLIQPIGSTWALRYEDCSTYVYIFDSWTKVKCIAGFLPDTYLGIFYIIRKNNSFRLVLNKTVIKNRAEDWSFLGVGGRGC
jgi:hypothetical protein